MGKRSNDLGQLKKEDYEAALAETSNAPKGPFAKASGEVMERRRIVRATRKSPAVKKSSTASNPAPANSSIFSSVSLKSDSGAFGVSSFGKSAIPTASIPAPMASSSYPSFAMPATTSTIAKPPPTTTTIAKSVITAADKERIKCAESFRKHMSSVGNLDLVAMNRFIITYSAIRDEEDSKMAASSYASTISSTTEIWNPSRPLFPTNPLTLGSTTAMTPTAPPLFGGKPVVPSQTATGEIGGFSFSLPTTTATAAAPVPSFSFSTKPTAEVKTAAATIASSSPTKADDNNSNHNEETTVLEASDEDYKVICRCQSKVLQASSNKYVAKGNLKLEQNKENKKYRVVVRDKIVGKVLFNVAINHGMPLDKTMLTPSDTKKNMKPTYIVLINAVLEKGTKPQLFKIVTLIDDQKVLYNELKKIVG